MCVPLCACVSSECVCMYYVRMYSMQCVQRVCVCVCVCVRLTHLCVRLGGGVGVAWGEGEMKGGWKGREQ